MDETIKNDIEKRYIRMLMDYPKGYGNDGKVNCYTCDKCGRVTKTVDVDNGVTPLGIECPYCHGDARSSFYEDIAPMADVTCEFYRPSLNELMEMVDTRFFTVSMVLSGGLVRRERHA